MDSIDWSPILSVLDNLRKDVKADIREARDSSKEDLSRHVEDDNVRLSLINTKLEGLLASQNMARGVMYTLLTLQGLIVLTLSIVEAFHIVKHP